MTLGNAQCKTLMFLCVREDFYMGNICVKPKAGRFVGESRLLCGCSISRQCNIFIGCKPHGGISHTLSKLTTHSHMLSATVSQPEEHWTQNLVVVGLNPTWDNVCALSSLGFAERATNISQPQWNLKNHQKIGGFALHIILHKIPPVSHKQTWQPL